MPTFDFQCRKCENVFEWERPFGSKALPACPACKSRKTEKLLTPPAIQFKGKGFYKTDSRPHPPTPSPKGRGGERKNKETSQIAEKQPEPACGGDCAACPLAS